MAPLETDNASNLSACGVAKWTASDAWSSWRMLTPNIPAWLMACRDAALRLTQMRIIGGSNDRELIALAVMPKSRPSSLVVMTVTPLAKRPTTSRKTELSNSGCGRGSFTNDRLTHFWCA